MQRAAHSKSLLVLLPLVGALCLGLAPRPAPAHEGHDGGGPAPVPAGVSLSPRLVAHSSDFELVGIARGKTLSIYLDGFADNQPVIGAKLDVEADGQTLSATAGPSGIYTLTADWVAHAGHHDVIITIIADRNADLLAGTLEVPSAPAAASAIPMTISGAGLPAPPVGNVLAFLLGMLAIAALWRGRSLVAIAGGAAHRRIDEVNAAARRAGSFVRARILSARFAAGDVWPGFRLRPPREERSDRALWGRFEALLLRRRAAKPGAGGTNPGRRVSPALARVWTGSAIGRAGTSTVAVICLVAIVVLALLMLGRGVLAHEGHDAPPANSAVAAVTAQASAETGTPGGGVDSGPRRLLDGSLFVPKASQRLLNVRTVLSRTSAVGRSVRMVGQVIADPGTSGEIHASIRGRLEPYRGVWPQVGQQVQVGDVLAWVVPVVNPIDRGIILQQVAQIDHEIARTQDRLSGSGAASGHAANDASTAATPRELDDARSDLANLMRRRDAVAAVIHDRDTLRAPLLAPSTGIVAASFAAAGQIVDEQQKLFTVVDLKRLWVEAYAYDIAAMGAVLDANAQGPTGSNYHLKFISRGPQLQRQTIPLYFRIDNPDAAVSVGSLLSVLVETGGERSGVILPRAAVSRNNSGQDIVWHHAYPESFVPIPVRTEAIDGSNVLIAAGVVPDMRVVVESADLLNEVR